MEFGFGAAFSLFQVMFTILFVVVFCMFIVGFVRGISTWSKNNNAPRLTVEAGVVAKRTNVSHHHHGGDGDMDNFHDSTSTSYYVTFQVESGDRMEFHVSGSQYGMLVEGDRGKLSFQGTRYLSFERI